MKDEFGISAGYPPGMQNGLDRLMSLGRMTAKRGQLMAAQRDRFQAIEQRHIEGTAPRAVTGFNLFQTPPEIAERMVSLARLWLVPGSRVLEPSAGLGRLLEPLESSYADWLAVEESVECARALRDAFKSKAANVHQRDFLSVTPEETGLFDVVLMNPPFKQGTDIRHIQHARQFLKPYGRLVGLCYAGARQEAALRPLAATWERLPARSFHSEGTDVDVNLFTIDMEE